jgi:hypothetical protein
MAHIQNFVPTFWLSALLTVTACPDDEVVTISATEGSSSSTSADNSDTMLPTTTEGGTGTSSDTGTTDLTTGATTDSGTDTEGPIDCADFHSDLVGDFQVSMVSDLVEVDGLCDDIEPGITLAQWAVTVWRPALDDINNEWPPGVLPWIVLQHGNGQSGLGYMHIVNPLVERGFVVVSPQNGDISADIVPQRSSRVRCTVRWAAQVWAEREHLGPCLSLIGHSNGGGGTFRTAGFVNEEMPDTIVSSVVGIASSEASDTTYAFGFGFPYLSLVGSRDDDTDANGIKNWERVAPEESSSSSDSSKTIVWAYDVDHDAWGGNDSLTNTNTDQISLGDMEAKGNALLTAYVPPFLAWQVLGEAVDNRRLFADGHLPPELDVDVWWSYNTEWMGDPLVLTTFQTGCNR